MHQKLLHKRIKSQHENYMLKSNQDLQSTNARITMTSIQKVKGFNQVSTSAGVRPIKENKHDQMSKIKEKISFDDPEFFKYMSNPKKSSTAFGPFRPEFPPQVMKTKVAGKGMDYQTFTQTLNERQTKTANDFKADYGQDKFLSSIKNVNQLNHYMNIPSQQITQNHVGREVRPIPLTKPNLEMLDDEQVERRLLKQPEDLTLDGFEKYLSIMLARHLKFNEIEESEIKKRKLDDLDLNHITEHFISKKSIIDKVFTSYLGYKATQNIRESQFVERIFHDLKTTLEFYIDLTWKLRQTREDEFAKNKLLIDQNNDFLNAMTAVKQMKSTENLDYYLFGIKRLTEQKYFGIMHAAKSSLKVANHELAFRQVKFIDDFYEFLLSQQKKIEHNECTIKNLEIAIKQLQNENKLLAEKTGIINKPSKTKDRKTKGDRSHSPDLLDEIYEDRYKGMLKQKEDLEKQKNKMALKLVKINQKVAELREELSTVRCDFKEDHDYLTSILRRLHKRISYEANKNKKLQKSRPKAPIIDLDKVFHDQIKTIKLGMDPNGEELKTEVQSQAWALAIINLVYLQKTKKDIDDFKDGRALIGLREFTIQWF